MRGLFARLNLLYGLLPGLLLTAWSCSVDIREGQFLCDPMESDPCPSGWVCLKRGMDSRYRCYSSGTVYCGNGNIDPGEQCDPGDPEKNIPAVIPEVRLPTSGAFPICTPFCKITISRCGNGLVESNHMDGTALLGEECDDGNRIDGDGCSSVCTVEPGYCDASEIASFGYERCQGWCGDGIRNGPEVCDGSDSGGMSCTYFGFHGGVLRCRDDCSGFDPSGCTGWCGDGIRNGPEVCDGPDAPGTCTSIYDAVAGPLHCTTECIPSDVTCRFGWKEISPTDALGDAPDLKDTVFSPAGYYAVTSDRRILRYDGSWSVWQLVDNVSLTSITFYNNSIITAGYNNSSLAVLYTFDGTSWNPFPVPEGAGIPVHIRAYDRLYLVTADTLYAWNGSSWNTVVTASTVGNHITFTDMMYYPPLGGIVLGTNSGVYVNDGTGWTNLGVGESSVNAMHALDDMAFVTLYKQVLVWQGSDLVSSATLPTAGRLDSICGWPSGNLLAPSTEENKIMYHMDSSWLWAPIPGGGHPRSVACDGGFEAMSVGDSGYAWLFRGSMMVSELPPWAYSLISEDAWFDPRDGITFLLAANEDYGSLSRLYLCRDAACETVALNGICTSVYGLSGGRFVAGCADGKVRLRLGDLSSVTTMQTPGFENVTAVYSPDGNSILAGTDSGQFYYFDGMTWHDVTPSSWSHPVNEIRGRGSMVLAVSQSHVLQWDGSSWHDSMNVPGVNFQAVCVSSSGEAFVGGTAGTVYRYDGTTWTKLDTPFTSTVRDIKPYGDGILVAGENGLAATFQGTSWGSVVTPPDFDARLAVQVTKTRWWLTDSSDTRLEVLFGPDSWGNTPQPAYCGSTVTGALDATGTADSWCNASGLDAGEKSYTLDVPISGKIQISLQYQGNHAGLFVLDENGHCLAEASGAGPQYLSLMTQRKTRLTITVDGDTPAGFTLSLTCSPWSSLFEKRNTPE